LAQVALVKLVEFQMVFQEAILYFLQLLLLAAVAEEVLP
jgi:hypothetical protein